MAERHFSFINKAYDAIYGSASVEEVEAKIAKDFPKYDPCDTTLDSKYDSAFKEGHSDKGLVNHEVYCLEPREVKVIKDKPFNPPVEMCCGPVIPVAEKAFVRPTAECPEESYGMIPCDSRVKTLVSDIPALSDVKAEGDAYFEAELKVEGVEKTENHVVSQPNVNIPNTGSQKRKKGASKKTEGVSVPEEGTALPEAPVTE